MKIRNALAATAALTLVAAPAVAQADFSRISAPVEGESELAGSSVIIGLLAAAAVVGAILIAVDNNDNPISR
ncbi:hypothetical protein EYB45_00205 [Erythrobacteraceae bacterium CFH 75059]|uniref:hypothetical protein n=1 Tax=Qipengyuania thermophila TaxID=2509361 RepID=UPI001020B6E0|nr:hypothetical protein [Qipengyuania thermophila]TCD06206.1 hypothetical protein EYB45_00205 [Erythrobacteraceae bacterium CFH 75059]